MTVMLAAPFIAGLSGGISAQDKIETICTKKWIVFPYITRFARLDGGDGSIETTMVVRRGDVLRMQSSADHDGVYDGGSVYVTPLPGDHDVEYITVEVTLEVWVDLLMCLE